MNRNPRYERQILMPEIGPEGQLRLSGSRVVVFGLGGLGCSAAAALALAGVGDILLVDYDLVEPSNLNRQFLHWPRDIGHLKVESAVAKLQAMNPDIRIMGIRSRVGRDNIMDILTGVDVMVDALDNFPARFVLNMAAYHAGIPLVHGACSGFEGHVTTLVPQRTPCLKCLFRESPPEEICPVIGITPMLIGTLQAAEVIKSFLGLEGGLWGRMLHFDCLSMASREIKLERDPDCSVCGRGRAR